MDQKENSPVSIGNWILTQIILCIPLVNFIMLLVWAFGENTHPSKRTFAKAILLLFVIGIGLSIIFFLFSTLVFGVFNR